MQIDPNPMQIDPKKIWQDQDTERKIMSTDEIGRRSRELQVRSRLGAQVLIGLGLLLCPCFAFMAARVSETVPRIGWIVLSLWALYSAWHGYRHVWPREILQDGTLLVPLDFYRRELTKQLDYGRRVWLESGLLWLFVGLALIIAPAIRQWMRNGVPFLALLAVWFVAFLVMQRRKVRKLQREIDELNAVDSGPACDHRV